ncbi:hypothetical protein [Rhizobium rhizogenes]|uniref:hypothetical protein n=1 Tax=Rhizobium rhizogenes TaxID=359 RepID=UPI001574D49C|nr:hypothetical protein [Rhizobium rhizogenes]NTF67967.1 hypothetical protein [Rhizobium rhizogenes]
MKKLKAPIGADGANIGTSLFKLDTDGNVTVPDDAVQTLIGVGGFSIIADVPVASEGETTLVSLNGPSSCSFGGKTFTTDDNGYVVVPTDLVGSLLSHGFSLPVEVTSADETEAAPPIVAEIAVKPEVFDIPAVPLGEKPLDLPAASEVTTEPAATAE